MQINSILGRMNTKYLYYTAPKLDISHVKYGKEYIQSFHPKIKEQTLRELFKEVVTQIIHND